MRTGSRSFKNLVSVMPIRLKLQFRRDSRVSSSSKCPEPRISITADEIEFRFTDSSLIPVWTQQVQELDLLVLCFPCFCFSFMLLPSLPLVFFPLFLLTLRPPSHPHHRSLPPRPARSPCVYVPSTPPGPQPACQPLRTSNASTDPSTFRGP